MLLIRYAPFFLWVFYRRTIYAQKARDAMKLKQILPAIFRASHGNFLCNRLTQCDTIHRGLAGKEIGCLTQEGQNSMKVKLITVAIAGLILAPSALLAQAPPAGATGKCKDGTYTTSPTKSGACRGHQGVDTWLAASAGAKPSTSTPAPAPAPAPAAKASSTPAPASTPTPAAKSASTSGAAKSSAPKTVAPGGGPGLVWLNTSSKVYHCYGGADYGTTKAGKYMSEADAKAAGGKAARGQACSK
jgi:Protein of unknown function (DUF3761)